MVAGGTDYSMPVRISKRISSQGTIFKSFESPSQPIIV